MATRHEATQYYELSELDQLYDTVKLFIARKVNRENAENREKQAREDMLKLWPEGHPKVHFGGEVCATISVSEVERSTLSKDALRQTLLAKGLSLSEIDSIIQNSSSVSKSTLVRVTADNLG